MGNYWVKIRNDTPYPISYVCAYQVSYHTARAHETVESHSEDKAWHKGLPSYIYLKQGRGLSAHECMYNPDIYWNYNGLNFRTFTITERGSDRSQLELRCDSGPADYITFPNRARKEELELEKQREEARRRQRLIERGRQKKSLQVHMDEHVEQYTVKQNGFSFQYNEYD